MAKLTEPTSYTASDNKIKASQLPSAQGRLTTDIGPASNAGINPSELYMPQCTPSTTGRSHLPSAEVNPAALGRFHRSSGLLAGCMTSIRLLVLSGNPRSQYMTSYELKDVPALD